MEISRHTLDRELELLHMAAAYAPCPYVIHYLNRHNDPAVAECTWPRPL